MLSPPESSNDSCPLGDNYGGTYENYIMVQPALIVVDKTGKIQQVANHGIGNHVLKDVVWTGLELEHASFRHRDSKERAHVCRPCRRKSACRGATSQQRSCSFNQVSCISSE